MEVIIIECFVRQVLLSTTQLYYYFFHKTPQMQLKRALMVLAASLEYERSHNSEVVERQSDNVEVPQVRIQK
jgi:translocation protein SEC63